MPENEKSAGTHTKREAMISKAVSLLGCGYIYGATGWICTRARLDQQAKQYPQYADKIYRYGPRWYGKPCYDCAQLTRAVAKAAGISLPSGTTSQWRASSVWKEKGTIDTMPAEGGIFLYTASGRGMSHTGVTISAQEEIDARGHAYGVVLRRIENTAFTHWARLAVDYGALPAQENLPPAAPVRRTLRRGADGEDVRFLQAELMRLGYSLAPYGADGKFGSVTRRAVRQFQQDHALAVDGVVGRNTWGMLERLRLQPDADVQP